ncbi:MAG TPA: 50S ribosomal protein L15 [Candidatus Saccharimonadales bacterium]|nr:50S ribosomal protein L15 [Candidatus Saccharimonadales bacterium]
MKLNNLDSIKNLKEAKRIGRGESSGKGKTSGKGHKGQKARGRGKVRLGFEGGQLPLIKRLPFRRGVGNNLAKKTLTITFSQLENFSVNEIVNEENLLKKGLLLKTARPDRIRVVAKGELTKPLTFKISASKAAIKQIEKAKGKIDLPKVEESKDA